MNEEWRAVLGYEGYYEVSSLGRVKRTHRARGATAGRILKQKLPNYTNDYCCIQLCRNGIKRTFAVHVLVAEAFHGKRPRGKLPNHKDLNKTNNREANLEWLTRRQNIAHALKNGRKGGASLIGEANGRAVLSEGQVALIRKLRSIVGQRELALLCGVSKSAIQFIHRGKRWRNEWPEDLRIRKFPS